MALARVRATLPASSAQAFDLLHDYQRRLEWDTLLSEAYLLGGKNEAGLGVASVCRGRRSLGAFALETVYVSFRRPRVAAVKMVRPMAFFAKWAASIRHCDLAEGGSSIEYCYSFVARPRWLRWLLEPILNAVFRWETRRRLTALARYLGRPSSA
jgi:hypothetical protein